MEFKDRVANKPNRMKLTYEDSGASAYATIELADEPIEEGTPLNALNMNKLLNKENNDYIVERGTQEVDGVTWTYEKWASGEAVCRCYTTTHIRDKNSLSNTLDFPFTMTSNPLAQVTKIGGIGYYPTLYASTAYIVTTSKIEVFVCNSGVEFSNDDTLGLSVEVKGKWK